MKEGARRVLQALLHIEDTPHRTALAFGIGVAIAFSPLLGIHLLIALAIAFLFNLNRVAILVGTYINNPWTIAPMYIAGTSLGCLILGISTAGLYSIDWSLEGRAQVENLMVNLRPYLWPYVLGNTILGVAAGGVSYVLLLRYLESRARRKAREAAEAAVSGGQGG